MWLLLPLAVGAMWWPMFGGVAVVVLAMSCWFRWIGIREIKRGFALGGIGDEFGWLRVWQVMNSINAGGGLAVAIGVLMTNGASFPEEGKALLVSVENVWFVLLVLELLAATRMISSVAVWLESTWVSITQAIVACLLLFSLALHFVIRWMPSDPADSNAVTLARAAAILVAAACGLVAIWWIADGVNRMSLALADEMSEEAPTAGKASDSAS
ncbi:MAG: hypothetical protein K8R92_02325 [Planctomycetes bacterium]|nr:hypothetical protein [Planctomycetota bacterium]